MYILTDYSLFFSTNNTERSWAEGNVFNNPKFADGSYVYTSTVVDYDHKTKIITTRNSKYLLQGHGTVIIDGEKQC